MQHFDRTGRRQRHVVAAYLRRFALAFFVNLFAEHFDAAAVCHQPHRLILDAQLAPQLGREQDSALAVHFGFGAQIVRVEGDVAGQFHVVAIRFEKFFVAAPHFDGVYLRGAAIQTRDEELLFLQNGKILLEGRRQLHAAFIVQPSGVHSPWRLHHQQLLT